MKTRTFAYHFSLISIYIFCIVKLSGCSNYIPEKPDQLKERLQATPSVVIYKTTSAIVMRSFAELMNYADLVITESVIAKDKIVNTSRNADNISEADSSYFSIGQVYQVEVEEYHKGKGPEIIFVVQNQGGFPLVGEEPSSSDLEKEIARKIETGLIPLQIDTPYLMFLRELPQDIVFADHYQEGSLFTGLAHPWRFNLGNLELVTSEDEIRDLSYLFPPQSYITILELMKQPFDPNDTNFLYPMPVQENGLIEIHTPIHK